MAYMAYVMYHIRLGSDQAVVQVAIYGNDVTTRIQVPQYFKGQCMVCKQMRLSLTRDNQHVLCTEILAASFP